MRSSPPSVIRRLVFVTIVAGLVTGVVTVLVVQAIERRSLLAEAEDRNRADAVRAATLFDSYVDGVAEQLALVASGPSVIAFDDDVTDRLATTLRVSDALDELVLHDADGVAVAAAATSSLLQPEEIEPHEPADTETSHDVRIVGASEELQLEIAVPVEDPPGTTIGWLVGRAPLALLASGAITQNSDRGSETGIVAADGTVVAHRAFDRVVTGTSVPVRQLFADGQELGRYEHDGQARIVSGVPLRSLDGWAVAEQPVRDALVPVQAVTGALTGLFLAVIAAIVVVVIATGRRLLRPLGPLAAAAERVGHGERAVRVDTEGVGEVATLTAGFNRMASSLDQRQDELEQAETLARRSEERLRLMVEGVTDYAIVLLHPDGRVRTWNTGARRLIGRSPKQALGQPLSTVFDPDDPPPDPLATVGTEGRASVEGWCRRADGDRFWAAITITGLIGDDGAPYGYAVIIHDLTERRAAKAATDEALQRERDAAAELRRANALKDEFLGIAAHEIRTPLSVILGASRLLGRDGERLSPEDTARVRGMIETHADDMRTIVDRLLEFTRLQAGRVTLEPEPVRLLPEIEQHVRSLGRHIVAHNVELDIGELTVSVDRSALRHITTNLLSNAAKFSPAGSTITVRAVANDDEVALSVQDHGVGVPQDDQELIFDLFRQASREVITGRGTGVGLAIVKRYVDLLGGHVSVDSSPDTGSTFTVVVPR